MNSIWRLWLQHNFSLFKFALFIFILFFYFFQKSDGVLKCLVKVIESFKFDQICPSEFAYANGKNSILVDQMNLILHTFFVNIKRIDLKWDDFYYFFKQTWFVLILLWIWTYHFWVYILLRFIYNNCII